MATGTLFNGISQGADYGDDWQMPTNYPVIRLSKDNDLYGRLVYYARTYNWNSTGVMRGSAPDTTWFALPDGMPGGTYELEVTANGIHSDTRPFTACSTIGVREAEMTSPGLTIYPNPAKESVHVSFTAHAPGPYTLSVSDLQGREVSRQSGTADRENNVVLNLGVVPGIYVLKLNTTEGAAVAKIVVE